MALAGLDLEIQRGTIFGFLGPNGAGKTTTLRLLTGLAHPTSGSAMVAGVDAARSHDRGGRRGRVDAPRDATFGYLDQDPRFYGWMRGRELLELVADLYRMDRTERRARIAEMLELVGLSEAAGRSIGGYSGGMRQRLGLAAAMLARPAVLFLDEPVSALDPAGRHDILEVIGRLRGTTTVFMSTHILNDVERVCDRVAILDHGRLLADAPIEDLLARYAAPVYRLEPEAGQEDALEPLATRLRGRLVGDGRRDGPEGLRIHVTDPTRRRSGAVPGDRRHRRRGRCPRAAATRPWRTSSCASWRRARPAGGDRGGVCMTGYRVLLRKELREQWRTMRLGIVVIVYLVFGILSPVLARYMPELITGMLPPDQVPLRLPTPTTADAIDQFVKNVGGTLTIAAVLLAMGMIVAEKERGTAAFILTKPAGRGAFVGAKLTALAATLAPGLGGVRCRGVRLHRVAVRAAACRGLRGDGRARLARAAVDRVDHPPRERRWCDRSWRQAPSASRHTPSWPWSPPCRPSGLTCRRDCRTPRARWRSARSRRRSVSR